MSLIFCLKYDRHKFLTTANVLQRRSVDRSKLWLSFDRVDNDDGHACVLNVMMDDESSSGRWGGWTVTCLLFVLCVAEMTNKGYTMNQGWYIVSACVACLLHDCLR